MGPITSLLLFPVAGPTWALVSLVDRLREEAEASLDDEAKGFAELTELSMRRSAGMLSDTEYAEQESALLARLNTAREYREQLQAAMAEDAPMEDEIEGSWGEDDWIDDDVVDAGEAEC
jgi:hypothetical protein